MEALYSFPGKAATPIWLSNSSHPPAVLSYPRLLSRPPCRPPRTSLLTCRSRRRKPYSEPVLKQTATEQVEDAVDEVCEEEEEVADIDMLDDEIMEDDFEDFDDIFEMDDVEPQVGDGGDGGGICLSGTSWDKEALSIAEEVCLSFDGDLKLYAFKTSPNSLLQVRIEKLSNRSGSPSMSDIEAFASAYQTRLNEAVAAGALPDNLSLEVSSPGVERVVRIPEDLERFKERPMYVKYIRDDSAEAAAQEIDGIFRLISYSIETGHCTWGIADVRANRERAGKGRPLSKKQREWRLETPFSSLVIVRIHSEC